MNQQELVRLMARNKYKTIDKMLDGPREKSTLFSTILVALYITYDVRDKMNNWQGALTNVERWYHDRGMDAKVSAPYLYKRKQTAEELFSKREPDPKVI